MRDRLGLLCGLRLATILTRGFGLFFFWTGFFLLGEGFFLLGEGFFLLGESFFLLGEGFFLLGEGFFLLGEGFLATVLLYTIPYFFSLVDRFSCFFGGIFSLTALLFKPAGSNNCPFIREL